MKIRSLAAVGALALLLTACSAEDPLNPETDAPDGESAETGDGDTQSPETGDSDGQTVIVGSQDYYSNEIIAEIYAQALEDAGFDVQRQFSIGQRDAYIPSIESGAVSIFPEYTGNLLQFYDPDTQMREADEVYEALTEALPDGLAVLAPAEASDQDSVTVTSEFAAEHDLSSIADLTGVEGTLTLGGPLELAERPYGPNGLKDVYGLDVEFSATGETTVEELEAGTVDLANVYTADPRIQTLSLTPLDDPEGLFLASHVVPVVSAELADALASVIDPVSAALSAEDLVAMNVQSQQDQLSAADIAGAWLSEKGLVS